MSTDRINARLPISLSEHVEKMLKSCYETPSEYIRDLIRRDMEKIELYQAKEKILQGLKDIKKEKYFKSSGDFFTDMQIAERLE